ncbi:pyrimidine/purine nucleoside phosphorylase [Candidatus Omnitrophota bacterium]
MVEVNEYFEGKVKSFELETPEGKKTVGVMEPGEYEFDVTAKEVMTVVTGELMVFFAEDKEWDSFGPGSSFDVPENSVLQVKAETPTAYLCEY